MGGVERLLIGWITEDQERLGQFLALLPQEGDEERQYAMMREIMAREIPHCGEFWRDLLLNAIAEADWEAVATALTDRRETPVDEASWLLVERRRQ